ncbi:hypothetical protein EV44_g3316 [Erysiphe necator]|uniref:CCHC-type domain-containing protein n=1 Tax=Uncinula necator TaxID=52586 RepID=A0A0B1PB17_UNCNE|nr:hypothetical protein EV44_g3316 [Erysiphe necator]
MDISLGLNARDVLINHIELSLPQTYVLLSRGILKMSSDQIANQVVHFTRQASRAELQNTIFQPYVEPKSSLSLQDHNNQGSSLLVVPPGSQNDNIFLSNQKETLDDSAYAALQNNECRICRRKGHWAKDCSFRNYNRLPHQQYEKDIYPKIKKSSKFFQKSSQLKENFHKSRPQFRKNKLKNNVYLISDNNNDDSDYDNENCLNMYMLVYIS